MPEWYITFGVQYGRREDDDKHPLRMYSDGYAVIEAPDEEMARRIAKAIFEDEWSMIYSVIPERQFAAAGELLRIAWLGYQ